MPYSPLGRGMLTGKQEWTTLEQGDGRASAYFPRFQGAALEANLRLVDEIGKLAADKGCTPGQLALAWVLRQKAVTSAIIGASRVAQVEDGARTVDNLALSDEELRLIERALQS